MNKQLNSDDQIKKQMDETDSSYDKEKLQERSN